MEKKTYLTFILGKEFFAVNVANVLEVLEHRFITPVPQAPEHIMGIINFRGDILPVLNTRMLFGLPNKSEEFLDYIIVFDMSSNENKLLIAATADAVRDVIEVTDEEIKPVPEMGISYNAKYISGVIQHNEKFILLLNAHKVLSISDLDLIVGNDEKQLTINN